MDSLNLYSLAQLALTLALFLSRQRSLASHLLTRMHARFARRYAPDQPQVADIEGRINNFIDVSDFVPFFGDNDFEDTVSGGNSSLSTDGRESSEDAQVRQRSG